MHFIKATILDEVALSNLYDVCWRIACIVAERFDISVVFLHPLHDVFDSLASILATYTTEAKRTIATNAIPLGGHATNIAGGGTILVSAVFIGRQAVDWMAGATLGPILKFKFSISNLVASTFRRGDARVAVESSNCMINFGPEHPCRLQEVEEVWGN